MLDPFFMGSVLGSPCLCRLSRGFLEGFGVLAMSKISQNGGPRFGVGQYIMGFSMFGVTYGPK